MKIKRFISTGNVECSPSELPTTSEELLGGLKDHLNDELNLDDVVGSVIFEGEDGRRYRVYVDCNIKIVDE